MPQNLPPPSPEQRERKMDAMLRQHGEDIQRLWKRIDLFPQSHFGDLAHGQDAFGTTSSSTTVA